MLFKAAIKPIGQWMNYSCFEDTALYYNTINNICDDILTLQTLL